jgi:hypothetical protein
MHVRHIFLRLSRLLTFLIPQTLPTNIKVEINPLNAELNPICHLLALGAHHILHVGRIGVNAVFVDKG